MDMKIRQDKKKWCISVPGKQNKQNKTKQNKTKPQTLSIFYNNISTKRSFYSRPKKKKTNPKSN